MSEIAKIVEDFQQLPAVRKAVSNPREPRSIINFMCGCDVSNPEFRKGLYDAKCGKE